MKLKPYPKYKPSGVEWLGDVPEQWRIKRIRYCISRNDGGVWGEDPVNDGTDTVVLRSTEQTVDGFWNIVDPALRSLTKIERVKASLKDGDLVITKSSGSELHIGKTSIVGKDIEEQNCCFSNFMQRLRVSKNTFPKFFWYIFNNFIAREQFVYYSNSTTGLANLNPSLIGQVTVTHPSFVEQQAIAEYLDYETGKIDELISKKELLIERLKEKRTAMISRAVTKGPNPDVRLKPSGVEWLGDVPEHWEVKKLSWLFWYSKGLNAAILTKEYVGSNSGDFPVYSGQTENDGLMGMIDSYEFDYTSPVILVTTVGAKAMTTRLLLGKFSLSQNCALIIPRGNKINSNYYESLLQPLFDYEKRSISLIMQPSLRFEDLNRFRVPLPPIDEQAMIAEYITRETGKIDCLIRKVTEAIEKLKEYRTALIGAAVTGKIDVRGVA